MDEFDSGWDEPPSSLDSEIMNNFDINEALKVFDQSELHQQVLEMRDDSTMSFHGQNITNHSISQNKEGSSVDCTSLSSEIFLATRLLHDETLDVTTLNTVGVTDSSPYNDHQNMNYLGTSTIENVQADAIDSIGIPQREALDSEFLFSSFERLNSEKQDYDEECSNKSWTESFPPSEIMPAPVQAIPKKKIGEKKPRERKRRLVKVIRKKSISMENTIEEVIKNSIGDTNSSDSDSLLSKSEHFNSTTELCLKNPILSNALRNSTEVNFHHPELHLKNPILSNALQSNNPSDSLLKNPILSNALQSNNPSDSLLKNPILSNVLENNKEVHFRNPPELHMKNPILSNALQKHSEVSLKNSPELRLENPILSNALQNNTEVSFKNSPLALQNDKEVSIKNPPLLTQNNIKTDVSKRSPPLTSQTFSINSGIDDEFLIPSTSGLNNIQRKDGRRVPSYLKMYRLRDNKYPDVFSCKYCFGIYTTLDAAIFHSCLRKRRGRRPKLLQDCVVPS